LTFHDVSGIQGSLSAVRTPNSGIGLASGSEQPVADLEQPGHKVKDRKEEKDAKDDQ
jgi:hypothetical protein